MAVAVGLAGMLARPIAHRGLHGCGGPGPIENTVAAAMAAVEAGYGVECDVRFTRDGTPVVIHDATLQRLAGRPEAVADLSVDELTVLPLCGGGTVPTLEALLAAVGGRTTLVIEIKPLEQPSHADAVLACVARYTDRIVLESFDRAVVARCHGAACPVGLVGPHKDADDRWPLPRCDFLSWDVTRLASLPAALPLTAWTVRTGTEGDLAAQAGAQIVFEGWRP